MNAKLTTEFVANNKVNGNFQKIVKYCNEPYYIKSITDSRVTLRKVMDKNTRAGRFNSGIVWFKNDETMTQWYLDNRIIK